MAMAMGPPQLRARFSPEIRARGKHYFYDARVRLDELNEEFLCGLIHGSRPYAVSIRCDGATLRAWCECPFAADHGELCKHIWAALITAHAADALGATLDHHRRVDIALEPPSHEEEDDEDEGDEEDVDALLDGDGEEDEDDDLDLSLAMYEATFRQRLALVRSSSSRSDWRAIFTRHRPLPSCDRDLELVVFIDVTELGGNDLCLHLGARRLTPAGPGPLEPLGNAGPERFDDPLDRLLFERVTAITSANAVFIGPETARHFLPALCREGRLRLVRTSDPEVAPVWRDFKQGLRSGRRKLRVGYGRRGQMIEKVVDHSPLLALPAATWDDGMSFEVVVRVGAREGSEALDARSGRRKRKPANHRVCVDLVRGDERIAAGAPWAIHGSGLFCFGDRIASFDPGQNGDLGSRYGWLSQARIADELLVASSELDELIGYCASDPAGPALELASDLGYREVRAAPVRVLELDAPSGRIAGMAYVEYDGLRVPLGTPGQQALGDGRRLIARDPPFEQLARAELASAGFRGQALDRLFVSQSDAGRVTIGQKQFGQAVLSLVALGWNVTGEGLRYRAATAASARIVSGIDWFGLDGSVTFGDVELSLPELLRALRKQRGRATIQLGDGSIGLLPGEWLARFGVLADAVPDRESEPIRFGRSQVGLVDACLALVPDGKAEIDARFEKLRAELAGFERVEPARPARSFRAKLRPYQELGLGWLRFLDRIGFGGCLADDMGLGKTVQVLALLHADRKRAKRPSLAVVPKSLIFNWLNEARRFAPELRVRVHAGPERSLADGFAGIDLVLTTYGTLRRDVALLSEIEFERLILDEAQAIKNGASATAKAARCLRAGQRLAMSGTPLENHLGELVSLFEFLNPGMFQGLGRLHKSLASCSPDAHLRKLVQHAVRPFILRRTKAEVAPELPERTEQTLVVELDPDHRKLYDDLVAHYRASLQTQLGQAGSDKSTAHVLEALLRLRQAACHPGLLDNARRDEPSAKLDLLLDKLRELSEEGHKALVFSQFTSLLQIVRERLAQAGIDYEYLDGKTHDRRQRVERFQSPAGPRVFLLSLKAGGVGLNLTAADYVFILDPWWNPAAEAQAIDRTHRIGQTRSIMAYRILSADTVEERVAELQEKKRALVSAIIGEAGEFGARLTRDDLEQLLGLGAEVAVKRRPRAGAREAARQ